MWLFIQSFSIACPGEAWSKVVGPSIFTFCSLCVPAGMAALPIDIHGEFQKKIALHQFLLKYAYPHCFFPNKKSWYWQTHSRSMKWKFRFFFRRGYFFVVVVPFPLDCLNIGINMHWRATFFLAWVTTGGSGFSQVKGTWRQFSSCIWMVKLARPRMHFIYRLSAPVKAQKAANSWWVDHGAT